LPLAESFIGMVVRAGQPKPDISTMDAMRSTLLAAKSIAYSDSSSGTYLSTIGFKKLGVADQLAGRTRKVRGPPSGEPVAAVVARGEADIGFQQVPELIHVPGIDFVGTVPSEVQPPTLFVGGAAQNFATPRCRDRAPEFPVLCRCRSRHQEGRIEAIVAVLNFVCSAPNPVVAPLMLPKRT